MSFTGIVSSLERFLVMDTDKSPGSTRESIIRFIFGRMNTIIEVLRRVGVILKSRYSIVWRSRFVHRCPTNSVVTVVVMEMGFSD